MKWLALRLMIWTLAAFLNLMFFAFNAYLGRGLNAFINAGCVAVSVAMIRLLVREMEGK